MSGSDEDDLPGGLEADAAEYALGVMPEPEREGFELRMEADPDLAQDVDAWTEYFSTLLDGVAPVPVPGNLLRRIEARLHGPERKPAWRLILPYLAGAVAGAVIAWVAMVSGLLVEPEAGDIRAELSGETVFAVRIDPASRTMWIDGNGQAAPEGRALEAWLIAPGADPLSLGVMKNGRLVIGLSETLVTLLPGATLAVSEEPAGGSPSGAPTGAVLASGVAIPL